MILDVSFTEVCRMEIRGRPVNKAKTRINGIKFFSLEENQDLNFSFPVDSGKNSGKDWGRDEVWERNSRNVKELQIHKYRK